MGTYSLLLKLRRHCDGFPLLCLDPAYWRRECWDLSPVYFEAGRYQVYSRKFDRDDSMR